MHPSYRVALPMLVATVAGCATSNTGTLNFTSQPAQIFAVEAPATASVNTPVPLKAWVQVFQNGGYDDAVLWPSSFSATVDNAAMTVKVTGKVLVNTPTSGALPTTPRNFFAVPQELTFTAAKTGTYKIEIAPENYLGSFSPDSNHRGPSGVTLPQPAASRTITIQ